MEKPGIEPATPGLQGIALIHYTTGASLFFGVFMIIIFMLIMELVTTVSSKGHIYSEIFKIH